MRVLLAFLLLLPTLSGCLLVGDFGGYWAQGVLDPKLEGPWRKITASNPNQRLSNPEPVMWLTKEGDYYRGFHKERQSPETHLKTLQVRDQNFLMLQNKEQTQGNMLILYRFEEGLLRVYQPDKEKWRAFFAEEVSAHEHIAQDQPMFGTLSPMLLEFLHAFSAQEDSWVLLGSFVRVPREAADGS